jgi:muramoyltetrapeptide carboxypeptidase
VALLAPSPLQKGDVVELVAPASGVTEAVYDSAKAYIERLGLVARAPEYSVLCEQQEGFLAASAERRLQHMQNALQAEDSKAIWCLTGGYGSYELLEGIAAMGAPKTQKWVVGYSDITVLLNTITAQWGWITLHAPMLKQIVSGGHTDVAVCEIEAVLFGRTRQVVFDAGIALNEAAKTTQKLEGQVLGGCASLLQSLIGTPQAFDASDKVLVLEDDKLETPARLHRVFDHMIRSGLLKGVKAVVLGGLYHGLALDAKERNELLSAIAPLASYLEKRNVPLVHFPGIGHCQDAKTVMIGGVARLQTGNTPAMEIEIIQQ